MPRKSKNSARKNTNRKTVTNYIRDLGPGVIIKQQDAMQIYVSKKLIPGPAFNLSSSAAGLIASVTPMTLNNWFNAVNPSPFLVFDMMKIHMWGISVRALQAESSVAIAGVTNFWFDQDDTTAPTYANTSHRRVTVLQNSAVAGVNAIAHIEFVPKGTVAKDWMNTTTATPIPGSFKVYTDAANFGTQASAQSMFNVQPWAIVSFAGLN